MGRRRLTAAPIAAALGLVPSADAEAPLPFPESLCHRCAAPPRYVRTKTSVYILCPWVPERYPRQPVRECPYFRPRE